MLPLALDLGTTKFTLAGSLRSGASCSVQALSVHAAGFRDGVLVHFGAATQRLGELFGEFEKTFRTPVEEVALGVSGPHLEAQLQTLTTPLDPNRPISLARMRYPLDHWVQNKRREPSSRCPIYAYDAVYQVDQRPWCASPLGLSGIRLRTKVLTVTADANICRDLVRVCNHAGVKIRYFVPDPIASLYGVTPPGEAHASGCVIDIGGGSADVIVLRRGIPTRIDCWPLGGEALTLDLSEAFNVSAKEAEWIKHTAPLFRPQPEPDLLTKTVFDSPVQVAVSEVEERVIAYAAQLAHQIRATFQVSELPARAGVWLTGGGSELIGLEMLLAKMLGCPVSRARVGSLNPLTARHNLDLALDLRYDDTLHSSRHATVLGILKTLHYDAAVRQHLIGERPVARRFRSLRRWVRDLGRPEPS